MPSSQGLFSKAIIESGACFTEVVHLKNALITGQSFEASIGCNRSSNASAVLDCMRSVSASDILSVALPAANATIDGYVLEEHPYKSFLSGNYTSVPLLSGNVGNEGSAWIYPKFEKPISSTDYADAIAMALPFISNQSMIEMLASNLYPCDSYNASDCRAALSQAFGDFLLVCPTLLVAEVVASKQQQSYSYLFTHHPVWDLNLIYGAFHSSEIDFVFDTLEYRPNYTQQELLLSRQMLTYWTNFGHSGNPNKPVSVNHSIYWPQFEKSSSYNRTVLDYSLSYLQNYEYGQCNFWKQFYV